MGTLEISLYMEFLIFLRIINNVGNQNGWKIKPVQKVEIWLVYTFQKAFVNLYILALTYHFGKDILKSDGAVNLTTLIRSIQKLQIFLIAT